MKTNTGCVHFLVTGLVVVIMWPGAMASAATIVLDFEMGLSGPTAATAEALFIDDPGDPRWPFYASQGTIEYGGLAWTGGAAASYASDTGDYSAFAPLNGALITQNVAYATALYNGISTSAVSGDEYGANLFGSSLTAMANGFDFILNGAYFTGVTASTWGYGPVETPWQSASSVTVEGFLDGVSQGSIFVDINPYAWTYADLAALGVIDSFVLNPGTPEASWYNASNPFSWARVDGSAAPYFRMDDLSYTIVPEPATLALLGIGLASLSAGRIRVRQKR